MRTFRPGGNCVAGIEYENDVFGQWVRPVSHRCDHAISDLEATCTNGSRCQILDVVEINVDRHAPIGHQTENWLITGVVARIGCQVLTQAFATTTDMLNAA